MHINAENIMKKICKNIHFVGIGGIGMSGIAEVLHNLGYNVQGSDIAENYNITRLKKLGIKIYLNHDKNNIKDADVIVKSTAIKHDNPEIIEARANKIPVVKRAEMLAELMRLKISIAISGSHGKTTTTSLMATMFEAAKLDPTVVNGGIINSKGTNAYLGKGDFLIAEADESDGTFIKVPSTIGIITNMDPEHLDYYGSYVKMREAFVTFIENLPFYGFGVLCKDHLAVAELVNQITDRKIVTYGIEAEDVNIKAVNIRSDIAGSLYDVRVNRNIDHKEYIIKDIYMPVPGIHNVLNSLAVIATAIELNFPEDIIKKGFESFKGVKRRFTRTGQFNDITIIDDYAHHPNEILATLKTAKDIVTASQGKIIAIMQPHRYTRLRDLFTEFTHSFNQAEVIFITDVYSAGESPINAINAEELIENIKKHYPDKKVYKLQEKESLLDVIMPHASSGDIIIFLGAGSITNLAYKLPEEIIASSSDNIKIAL